MTWAELVEMRKRLPTKVAGKLLTPSEMDEIDTYYMLRGLMELAKKEGRKE